MLEAVIFDVDGVLIDSYQAHYESWRVLASEHGIELGEERFAVTFGRTSRDILRILWDEELDPATAQALPGGGDLDRRDGVS